MTILPQQKTFIREKNEDIASFDKRVNAWIKEETEKGNHISPSGPSIFCEDGTIYAVYMIGTIKK